MHYYQWFKIRHECYGASCWEFWFRLASTKEIKSCKITTSSSKVKIKKASLVKTCIKTEAKGRIKTKWGCAISFSGQLGYFSESKGILGSTQHFSAESWIKLSEFLGARSRGRDDQQAFGGNDQYFISKVLAIVVVVESTIAINVRLESTHSGQETQRPST